MKLMVRGELNKSYVWDVVCPFCGSEVRLYEKYDNDIVDFDVNSCCGLALAEWQCPVCDEKVLSGHSSSVHTEDHYTDKFERKEVKLKKEEMHEQETLRAIRSAKNEN